MYNPPALKLRRGKGDNMLNEFAIVILLMLALRFGVNLAAELLNMASLNKELPEEFEKVFDAETYRKSQSYAAVSTKFRLFESAFDFAVLLIFWLVGGFSWLDIYVRGFDLNPILAGLMYVAILFFAAFLVSIPFKIYGTFVIEERFGLNKTTAVTFIADLTKSLLLSAIIGGAILFMVLWLFEIAGSIAWFYAWIAVSVVSILLMFIAPRFLMPLFYKFTPLSDGELKAAIYALADKLNFPLSGIYVIDGSRRSAKANAFFTGFGKHKRIALYDTLISGHTISELVAVLAHEIGHYKKKHMTQFLAVQILQFGIMLYLFSLAIEQVGFFAAFGVQQESVYAGLVLFTIAYGLIEEIFSVVLNVGSRNHEKEADRYAVDAVSRSEDLIDSLKKLSKNNLSNLEPHPFYAFLNYSHPPLLERFESIRKYSSKPAV